MSVGCTSRKLKTCLYEHIFYILNGSLNASGVAKHFVEQHASSIDDFSFFAVEKLPKPSRGGDWQCILCNKEAFWILHLDTRSPQGLNFRSDLLYIYL